jgi:uncharacterized membrane protein YfcA
MLIQLVGYSLLFFMGLSLGLLGAGGSILSIPLLIYFFHLPMLDASSYSLLMIGVTSLFGAFRYRSKIAFQEAFLLGMPIMIGMITSRTIVLPYLKIQFGSEAIGSFVFWLFVSILFISGLKMSSSSHNPSNEASITSFSPSKLITGGCLLGCFIGLIGIGGGFLILSYLLILARLNPKEAVPLSIMLTSMSAWSGVISDRHVFSFDELLWLSQFILPTLIGLFLGTSLLNRIKNTNALKRYLGGVLIMTSLVMAILGQP